MAIPKVTTTTQITHVSSGAAIAASVMSGSGDIATALSYTGNLAYYPLADVAFYCTTSASIASTSTFITLYRRDLNFDGANDEDIPIATSNEKKIVGSFQLKASTAASATHYVNCTDVPLSGTCDCEFYIKNNLGVNITAGWTLKVTPKSLTDA